MHLLKKFLRPLIRNVVKSTNFLLYGIFRNSGLQKIKAEIRKPKTLITLPYSKLRSVRKRNYNQKEKHLLCES
jgi:predicted amidophosphoribosyltransferase